MNSERKKSLIFYLQVVPIFTFINRAVCQDFWMENYYRKINTDYIIYCW